MMATDADIVRFAAPWPGAAARLLEGLAGLGPGVWPLERICQASAAGIEAGYASQVLAGLAATGICVPDSEEDAWRCDGAPAELRRLAHILDGAEHYKRLRLSPSAIELTVTMPMSPSYLEAELANILGRPGGFVTTTDVFGRLARAALERLVIMTPFVDAGGFRWIRRVFEATRADCRKVLILRDTDRYAVDLGVQHIHWLNVLGVEVFDYYLAHDTAVGRALPIETFHAKLVVADDALAYVGSANLLSSSEGISLETGLLVDGAAASQAARLIEAVLRVSRAL